MWWREEARTQAVKPTSRKRTGTCVDSLKTFPIQQLTPQVLQAVAVATANVSLQVSASQGGNACATGEGIGQPFATAMAAGVLHAPLPLCRDLHLRLIVAPWLFSKPRRPTCWAAFCSMHVACVENLAARGLSFHACCKAIWQQHLLCALQPPLLRVLLPRPLLR